jgi:hypothetical protein
MRHILYWGLMPCVVGMAVNGCRSIAHAPISGSKLDKSTASGAGQRPKIDQIARPERKFAVFNRVDQGRPTVITVAEVTRDEQASHPFLVLTDIHYKAAANGLPITGVLQKTDQIVDKVIEALKENCAVYVGHITGNDRMTAVFYVTTAMNHSILVSTGRSQTQMVSTSVPDRSWSYFNRHLKSSPVEREISDNVQLLSELKDKSDVAEKRRQVDFTLYFPSESKRESFLSAVATKGYTVGPNGRRETAGAEKPL